MPHLPLQLPCLLCSPLLRHRRVLVGGHGVGKAIRFEQEPLVRGKERAFATDAVREELEAGIVAQAGFELAARLFQASVSCA